MVMLMLAYYLWVVTLLDVDSRYDGVLSPNTFRVRVFTMRPLSSQAAWSAGTEYTKRGREDNLLEHLYP